MIRGAMRALEFNIVSAQGCARAVTAARHLSNLGRRLAVCFQQRGIRRLLISAVASALRPLVCHHSRVIWEAHLSTPRQASAWGPEEQTLNLGPESIDRALTPALRDFLGGDAAAPEIEGVRRGDRLFVVATETEYLSCSYIFFDTTRATRRQCRILGEHRNTPIIGLSYTASPARGRGVYKRLLNDMFLWLAALNYTRAICEVDPRNISSNRASAAAGMQICRELSDWIILKTILLQRVRAGGISRWRVLWLPRA